MKKVQLSHRFDFNLADVVAGREARYVNKDWWPEIIESKIENEEEKDGILYVSRRVVLQNKLPANKILKEGHYTFIEHTKQRLADNFYEIEVHLESHKSLLDFTENSQYRQFENEGQVHTERDIELAVHMKVPLLGPIAETFICKEFANMSDKDRDIIIEYLTSLN